MEAWSEIRRRVMVEGVSKRQIQRESGLHWKTLNKILEHSAPPGYRLKSPRPKGKIGPYVERIQQILKEDKEVPRKQRHTARRIFERLRGEGYGGGYTAVREVVRDVGHKSQEVFVPLAHAPGEAQFDFGYALARIAGRLRKVAFMVMVLPYSDAFFVQAFERECTETFWEGHVQAFEFFGGVPRRIVYDNTKVAVSQILGGRDRRLTRGFLQLKSHYLFDHRFCRVRRANEKGVVEGAVKYARLNFMVPVAQVESLGQFNALLRQRCVEDQSRRLRGKEGTKAQRLEEEQGSLLALPAGRFEAARKQSTTASSISLVRFDSNDYSVPVAFAHHPIVAKGYCEEVVLCHLEQIVARHKRIWEKEQVSFDPVHYLALLERKPGALDQARPLSGWALPECFHVLRRRLEVGCGGEGTREYIRVLRLLEHHRLPQLRAAVESALRVGAIRRDGVAQFLVPREEWRATEFNLDGHPHLRGVKIQAVDVAQYGQLLSGGLR
jgi:transposase